MADWRRGTLKPSQKPRVSSSKHLSFTFTRKTTRAENNYLKSEYFFSSGATKLFGYGLSAIDVGMPSGCSIHSL